MVALFLLGIVSSCLTLYLPHLNGTFILDDFPNLKGLNSLKGQPYSFINILEFLSNNTSGQLGRPISLITFALQADHWPNNPAAFKSINLLLHLLNGFLVILITKYLLKPFSSLYRYKWGLAGIIGGLWLVQPIHVSTVLYVVQRMTLLMAFFSLLAILGYLYGRNYCFKNARTGLIISTCSLVIGCLLSIFSKENGILILLYIAVIELTIFTRQQQPKYWQYWLWGFIYIPLILGGLYFLSHLPSYISSHSARNFSFEEHLLTEARILIDYLAKITLPRPNTFGLFFDDYPISKSILSPISTLFSIIILSIGFILALALRNKQPVFSFAILWFFAGHSLESGFIPLELYFEHRNYLPALGIVFALCYYSFALLQKSSALYVKYCFSFLIVIYCTGIYFICFQEAALWNNSALQASTWQKEHPKSKRANALLAQTWIDSNQLLKADQQLKNIHLIDSQDSGVYIMRLEINCYTQHFNNQQLAEILEKLKSTKTENATVQSTKKLISTWGNGNCNALSYDYMVKLLTIINNNTPAGRLKTHIINSFSLFYAHNNRYDLAIALLEDGIKQMPSATEMILLKIRWGIASNQYDLTLDWIKKAQLNNRAIRLRKINFENQLTIMENDIYALQQDAKNQRK